MRAHLTLALLCVPTLVSAELTHRLGVDITDYDDRIEGQNRSFDLDTQQYGLNYALGLDSGISFSLSGWQSASDTEANTNARLEREQQGWQAGVSVPLTAWFAALDAEPNYRLALTYAESDVDSWLRLNNGNEPYREQADSWSLGATLAGEAYWRALTISPSVGFSYQEYASSLWQQIQFRPGNALSQQLTQQDRGWSADAGLSLTLDLGQTGQTDWSLYLDLNWFEPLTLDSAVNQTSTLQRGSLSRSQSSRSNGEADGDGSGVHALGLFALWQDWSVDLSWSDSWATDTDIGAQWRLGLSRTF